MHRHLIHICLVMSLSLCEAHAGFGDRDKTEGTPNKTSFEGDGLGII